MGGINWSHLCQEEEVLCTLHGFNRTHGGRSEYVQKTKGFYIQKYTVDAHGRSTFLKATDDLKGIFYLCEAAHNSATPRSKTFLGREIK